MDKWLKEGSVELTVTRVNMHGPPGAGKTCAQHLLLNEDPPTDRVTDSTPIARPTVRATRVSVDNLKWEKVTRAGLLERLASDLNVAAASQPEEHTETTSPLHVHAHQPEQHNDPIINFPSIANSSPPVIDSASPITNDASSIASSNPVIINPAPSISSDSIEAKESIVSNNEASSVSNEANNDETETVIQEIVDTIQRSAVQLSGHWLYIIDSGGQPAYQELLPLFIRTASLNIITLDLSQPLDKKLDFQYRIGGETFSCGLNLKYSNREFFQSAVSSGAILKPIDVPHVLETPSHPMHFVLGTHYDLIGQDSLKKIDEELMSSLKPDIQNYVVHNKRGESIIFPVNTLIPEDEGRMEAGQKLCQSIANCGGTSLKMHMPIRWFAFELWLQKVAEKKSRNVLIIDEVISAGTRFKMSEDDTKDALQYLHSVTIVLYFPDILPQLVFIDPQPILEILSRLLALTYVERNALHLITNPVPLDEDINKLHNFGFFQEKLLYHLKSDVELFFPPHFEPSHLIKLLIHLRVITIGKDGDYFFPCALQAYTNLSVPQTETKPLLIVWQDKYGVNSIPVPQGMFPLLITHLLNQKDHSCSIEFPPLQPEYNKYRDALSLWIKIKGKRYTLHIINRYTHIEVYYDGSAKEAKVNCPYIREVVMTAVNQSADAINVKRNHINAFYCPKKKNCYCVVEEDYLVINCTLCTRSADISEDDESYWSWFYLKDCGLTDCTPEALIPGKSKILINSLIESSMNQLCI